MPRAATGDWNRIIVTHSAFKLLPTPVEFERQLIRESWRAMASGSSAWTARTSSPASGSSG